MKTPFHPPFATTAAAVFAAVSFAAPAAADDPWIASTTSDPFGIDTGYPVGPQTRIDADFEFLARTADTAGQDTAIGALGTYQQFVYEAGGGVCDRVYLNGQTGTGGISWSNSTGGNWTGTGATMVPGVRYRSRVDPHEGVVTLSADGVEVYCPPSPFTGLAQGTSTGSLKIFDDAALDGNHPAMMKLYGFRIHEAGTLVRDFVPALENGVAGLYDRIGGGFYRNARNPNVAFEHGGDIMEVEGDAWIAGDGTSAVNARHLFGPGSRIEVDYALDDFSTKQIRVFGQDFANAGRIALYVQGALTLALGYGTSSFITPIANKRLDAARHTCVVDATDGFVGLVTGGVTNYAGTMNLSEVSAGTRPVALFGDANADSGAVFSNCGKSRIYRARFWRGGVMEHDYVPCVKGGVPGFRDAVDGSFVTAENPAALTPGGACETIPDDGFVQTVGNDVAPSVGGHYFDTGYLAGPNTKIEIDYALAAPKSAEHSGDWWVFQTSIGNNNDMIAHGHTLKGNLNSLGSGYVNQFSTLPVSSSTNAVGVRRTAVFDAPRKTVSVVTAGWTNFTATVAAAPANMTKSLKVASSYGGGGGYTPLKLYGLRIYESGSLVRDYVPYVSNGQPGLRYGTTFTAFTRNGGITAAGEVIAGGTVATSSADDGDAYAESFGASAINTRYFPDSATRIELDYQVMLTKKSSTVAGTTEGGGTTFCLWVNGSGNLESNLGGWCGGWGANGVGAATTHRRTAVFDVPTRSAALYEHGGATPIATKDSSKINDKGKSNSPVALFATCQSTDGATMNYHGHVRIYRFKVWENNALVRDFVPYVAPDGTPCMFDAVEKEAFPATGLKVSGRGHGGAEEWIEAPASISLNEGQGNTFTARAVGAQRYVWTRDGEEVPGAAGETLTVEWTRGDYAEHAYTVTPVYDVFGEETSGAPVAFTVANNPSAFMMVVR